MENEVNDERLTESKREAIRSCDNEIRDLKDLMSDCEEVKQFVTDLPDKLSHDVMVKFGSCAFAPGTLVHSNEITVFLGDGWCAEMTAKQAAGYLERKLQRYKKTSEQFEQEKKNHEKWLPFIADTIQERKEHVNILEEDDKPFTKAIHRISHAKKDNLPEDLDEKRTRLPKNVKDESTKKLTNEVTKYPKLEDLQAQFEEIQAEKPQKFSDYLDWDSIYDTDELTETEEEESEDEDLANENEECNISKNSEIFKLDSDQLNENVRQNHEVAEDQSGDKHNKHVRWIDLSEAKSKCITFTHSKSPSAPYHHKKKNKRRRRNSSTSEVSEEEHEEKNGSLINSPSDIYKCFSYSFQQPKSILKSSSTETVALNDEFRDLKIDDNKNTSLELENEDTELEKNVNSVSVKEIWQNTAFTGEIKEHFEQNSSVEKITTSQRPRSLFKSSR